jgi:hypothetical protein
MKVSDAEDNVIAEYTLDERLYSLKDQVDPVAVCDTSGRVVERYDYSCSGETTLPESKHSRQE